MAKRIDPDFNEEVMQALNTSLETKNQIRVLDNKTMPFLCPEHYKYAVFRYIRLDVIRKKLLQGKKATLEKGFKRDYATVYNEILSRCKNNRNTQMYDYYLGIYAYSQTEAGGRIFCSDENRENRVQYKKYGFIDLT